MKRTIYCTVLSLLLSLLIFSSFISCDIGVNNEKKPPEKEPVIINEPLSVPSPETSLEDGLYVKDLIKSDGISWTKKGTENDRAWEGKIEGTLFYVAHSSFTPSSNYILPLLVNEDYYGIHKAGQEGADYQSYEYSAENPFIAIILEGENKAEGTYIIFEDDEEESTPLCKITYSLTLEAAPTAFFSVYNAESFPAGGEIVGKPAQNYKTELNWSYKGDERTPLGTLTGHAYFRPILFNESVIRNYHIAFESKGNSTSDSYKFTQPNGALLYEPAKPNGGDLVYLTNFMKHGEFKNDTIEVYKNNEDTPIAIIDLSSLTLDNPMEVISGEEETVFTVPVNELMESPEITWSLNDEGLPTGKVKGASLYVENKKEAFSDKADDNNHHFFALSISEGSKDLAFCTLWNNAGDAAASKDENLKAEDGILLFNLDRFKTEETAKTINFYLGNDANRERPVFILDFSAVEFREKTPFES